MLGRMLQKGTKSHSKKYSHDMLQYYSMQYLYSSISGSSTLPWYIATTNFPAFLITFNSLQ